MRTLTKPLLAVIAALGCLAFAPAPTVLVGATESMGHVLTDTAGHTLYTYDRGLCAGACTDLRRPLRVAAGGTPTLPPGVAGTLGTTTRPDDGTLQLTYDGSPLYTYTGDTQPSETNGITLDWHVVPARYLPAESLSTAESKATTPPA
ncbi:hypothetical protein ACIBVL_07230 [Streptomyces sp. NPDC049687]|uniref:hypothetical protein n=1 Tax=Streptomyces sp. NPDC049687 TaxID=3365596 RepID=UPI00379180BD